MGDIESVNVEREYHESEYSIPGWLNGIAEKKPSPERLMWRAVIEQGLRDIKDPSQRAEIKYHRQLAIDIYTLPENAKALERLCAAAGWDPEWVTMKAKKLLRELSK